jgi:hypothetical protein
VGPQEQEVKRKLLYIVPSVYYMPMVFIDRWKERHPLLLFTFAIVFFLLDSVSRYQTIVSIFTTIHVGFLLSHHILLWIGLALVVWSTVGFFMPISTFEFLCARMEPYITASALVVPVRAKGKKSYSRLTCSMEFRHKRTRKVISIAEANWLENRLGYVTMTPFAVKMVLLATNAHGQAWAAELPPELYKPKSISGGTAGKLFDRTTGIRVYPLEVGEWDVTIVLYTTEGKSYKHKLKIAVEMDGRINPTP